MRYFLGFVLFIATFSVIAAQSKSSLLDAFGKGDIETLGKQFDSRIELCFNSKIDVLDKASGMKNLKAFFDANPPKSCQAIHKGASRDKDSQYTIGLLQTSNGKSYRVYLYVEEAAGKLLIKEIRIDKEG